MSPARRTATDPRTHIEHRLGASITALLDALSQGLHEELREQDLTPPLAMTLRLLDEPRSMRFLADAHQCDASNITGIVDRLERRGLVERHADPSDRRVTLVHRTADGDTMRARLTRAAREQLVGIESLEDDELEQLADLLARLVG